MSPTKALSIRSPWWWYILHAGKDVENRDWRTFYRGPVLLHASAWFKNDEIMDDFGYAADIAWQTEGLAHTATLPSPASLKSFGGHIVGRADIVDCVTDHDSPWFFGPFGFVLTNPVAFATPLRCMGKLGLFTVPQEIAAAAARMAA